MSYEMLEFITEVKPFYRLFTTLIYTQVIDTIANAIRGVVGVQLLDVDAGQSTNRTVYTFVGGPDVIIEGALAAAKAAFPLINMRKHKGEDQPNH